MKCKKIISKLASFDIKENVLWYNSKRKGLGKEFAFQIRKTVNYICDFPYAFPKKYEEIRVAIVDVFPYTIHYFYEETTNSVFITCVFQDKNNPEIPIDRI